jgi:hypothetical protein
MCDKSPSPSSSKFIQSMPIGYALDQIYIFKVVQHVKAWTYVKFF